MAKTAKSHGTFMAKSRRKVGGVMPMTSKTKTAMLVLSKSGRRYRSRFREPLRLSWKRLFYRYENRKDY